MQGSHDSSHKLVIGWGGGLGGGGGGMILEEPAKGDRAEHGLKVGWVYDAGMEGHMYGAGSVECPERITTIRDAIERQGLDKRCISIPSREATDSELLRCHTQAHITRIDHIHKESIDDLDKLSIFANRETARAARLASGCVVQATRAVVNKQVNAALAVVRPPGHHAECARAMGFCFFCNCAVAAKDAIANSNGSIKKVLVLDWDVHHGNGIQDVLFKDPNILYISIHRDPSNFYPYVAGFVNEVGEGEGEGFNVNIPWATRGAGDLDYEAAFETVVEPIVKAFGPDLIIVAAGFDAAKGDPIGGCLVTPGGYADMTRRLQGLCGKMVLALKGGSWRVLMTDGKQWLRGRGPILKWG